MSNKFFSNLESNLVLGFFGLILASCITVIVYSLLTSFRIWNKSTLNQLSVDCRYNNTSFALDNIINRRAKNKTFVIAPSSISCKIKGTDHYIELKINSFENNGFAVNDKMEFYRLESRK